MANEVKLPRLGQGMESGTIVKWLKAEGDQVEKGEPLYELDTDKVTQEVEAEASGVLRKIAREGGIELGELKGTGREGRVVAEDVERAATTTAPVPQTTTTPAPSGEIQRIPLTSVRRTIARRLTEAWQAPAFQIAMSADMTRTQSLHTLLAEQTKEGEPRPTVTDILTKACADALMRHRAVNALWAEDAIELHPSANVSIAVAIEAGLVVPVIHQAERLTIAELAAARADIVARARANELRQDDLDGGTFTISNLGMFGVEQFVAVLNPPQAAILAVGAIESKAVPTETGFEARPLMTITLTCDHRSLDGATAADFLRTVKAFLEEPGLML